MTHSPDLAHTRTFSWDDPMIGAQAAASMSGLDYLQAMARGELPPPPIFRLMNIQGAEFSAGRAVFSCEPAEYHYNPIGVVHGGLASTLCDSALACAIHSTLPAGVGYTTLELHVNFVRALTIKTGLVRCVGETLHVGRTVATAQAQLTDAAGKLYAHATTTCLIISP